MKCDRCGKQVQWERVGKKLIDTVIVSSFFLVDDGGRSVAVTTNNERGEIVSNECLSCAATKRGAN